MGPDLRFRVSINRQFPGQKLGLRPAEKRWARYNASFVPEEHTSASLLEQIVRGYSFTAVLGGCTGRCCGGWCKAQEHRGLPNHCGRPAGYRRNQHFKSAQFIALDFDTGDARSGFDYLLHQPLIIEHGAFIYTTLSHTPEQPKARVVFITEVPFIDPDYYRRAKRALMAQLPWGDASVHDPCRLFYGSNPSVGQSHYLGNVMPLMVVNSLIEEHCAQLEAAQPRRNLPHIPSYRVMGGTPAERYVNSAVQQEAGWVASRVEGNGERHQGLLVAAMKLNSLSLSEWLPPEVRASIDPMNILLPAARANGYLAKYGEQAARQTIADGMAYAWPRPQPDTFDHSRPRKWRIPGGHLKLEVSL